MDRDLDLVLLGATGFVGRLTAAQLAATAPAGLRIGLAGRSAARLEQVRDGLPGAVDWPLLTVDVSAAAAVRELAERSVAIATTVGPYAVHGLPLVRACAAAGTHYADLTGEVLFAHRSITECHARAQGSGAQIVHACGFDSVPSDLGVWLTARQAADDGEGELTETVLHVRSLRGGISGGTIDSMRQQVIVARSDPAARAVLGDRYALAGGAPPGGGLAGRTPAGRTAASATPYGQPRRGGVLPAALRRIGVRQDPGTGRWNVPFVMGGFNGAIVRRSNALLDHAYGTDFRYREVLDTGRGARGAVTGAVTAGALGGLGAGLAFTPTRAVLDRLLPKPGAGPSERAMATGRFVLEVDAATTSGAHYRTTVAAEADPGYSGTAIMLGQAALALAAGEGTGSGVLTPATALGQRLVDRLRAHGFTFDVARAG